MISFRDIFSKGAFLFLLMPITLLAQSNADLVSGINESLKSGKIVSAQQLADKLYKNDRGRTADYTYLAAKVAAVSADKSTAIKRYLSFLSSQRNKTAETQKALTYLLTHNPNIEVIERFLKDHGTHEYVLSQGKMVLNELLENDDSEGACELARILSKAYDSTEVNTQIVYVLRSHLRVFDDNKSQRHIFSFLSSTKKLNSRVAYEIIRHLERSADQADYLMACAEIQINTGSALNRSFSAVFGRLPSLKSNQKKLALKFLEHDKVCKTPRQYYDYLNFISRNPKVFRKADNLLIDDSKITDKLAALVKLAGKPELYKGPLSSLASQISREFIAKSEQAKFWGANKAITAPDFRKQADALDNSPLSKLIKNSIHRNRFDKLKNIKAELKGANVANMVNGKDTSPKGKAIKLLHDAHLMQFDHYGTFWAEYLKGSEAFWETAIKNMIFRSNYPKGFADMYADYLNSTKKLPDYGKEFLIKTHSGVSSPEKMSWLRTQYANLGTDTLRYILNQRWKAEKALPETISALKAIKGKVDNTVLLTTIRSISGKKLGKSLTAQDVEKILEHFKGQSADDLITFSQLAARGFDKTTSTAYIQKVISLVNGLDKFRLLNKMYINREFNNYRNLINKEINATATKLKDDDWNKLVLDTNVLVTLERAKNPIASKLLNRAANGELWMSSSTSYLQGSYYNEINKIVDNNIEQALPLISSWAIAASGGAHDRNFASRTLNPLVAKLEKNKSNEALYMMSALFLERVKDADARKIFIRIRSKSSKDIDNLIPVDKSDKRYDLYIAAESLALGDIAKAWKLTQPKIELIKSNWAEFDSQYVIWVAKQLLEENANKEALALVMTVLLEESSLNKETATALALIKGDIFKAEENYPAARTEYQALTNNPESKKTEAGKEAVYRLVDLMILTKDYATAELQLNRLVDSNSLEVQAEANYFLAKLYYQQKEYVTANDYLQQTFKRIHGHVAGRLLEGELKLHLPRGLLTTEIAVGRLDLQTVVIPGSTLTLKLQDRNLAIARGGKAIPVDIITSSGDKESISLLPSETDSTLFVGQIPSVLGKIAANNGKLEVRGDDKISYAISKEFQKKNKIDYPSKDMIIKANAKLEVSSGDISDITDGKKKKKKNEEFELNLTKRDEINRGLQVRPGSPVYIVVKDLDRDISEKKDKVLVDIQTTSGDIVSGMELVETSEHSGIFKAVVNTGIPFPLVTASDIDENQDPNAVINSGRNKSWSSIADSKKSKWLEVDTMSSYEMKTAGIKLAKQNVKSIKLYGLLEEDLILIGSFPESKNSEGGLQAKIIHGSIRSIADFKKALKFHNKTISLKSPSLQRSTTEFGKRNDWASSYISGTFWMNKSELVKLKFLQKPTEKSRQYTMVYIDDKLVLGKNRMNVADFDQVESVFLRKGAHKIEIYNVDADAKSTVQIGYEKADGSFEILPDSWFSTSENPGLADLLKPKGKVIKTEDGFKAEIDSNVRLRKIRWAFEDYNGANVEIVEINATDQSDKVILPVKNDFTSGKTNNSLEIAAGDNISFKYKDDKRLGKALAVIEKRMNATFANAEISMVYEVEGATAAARRVRKGDQVLIQVTDFDEDKTPKPDVIVAKVRARSGATLDLKLLETENSSGVFTQILGFGDKTEKETIAIEDNDEIVVSYLDMENNSPGIPTERIVKVDTPVLSQPSLSVYKTSVQQIEDRSSEADKKRKRILTMNPDVENVVIFKNQIIAEDKHAKAISLNAPLMVKLLYPQVVRHTLSQYKIEAVAQSQLNSAKKEPAKENENLKLDENKSNSGVYTEIPLKVGDIKGSASSAGYNISMIEGETLGQDDAMEIGLLSATIHLQLGSPGDDIEKIDDSAPTLIVNGNDTILIRVRDDQGKIAIEEKIELRSDARLSLLDRNYSYPVDTIHMGQRFYLHVNDPDQDLTDKRDFITVNVKSASGASVEHKLTETLNHSGVFTAPLKPEFATKPKAGEPADTKKQLTAVFGDTLTMTYQDKKSLSGTPVVKVSGKIHKGADGSISVFTKRFKDEDMAVKTRFLMAEALFEMAREHRKLKKVKLADDELARGKRILQEAIRDYPNTSLKVQGEYLLANLAQELKKYEEAITRYSKVISTWPDSEYAPKSLFKKAICLEKMNQIDKAAEEYVKVTYLYPDSDLTSDAVIRMATLYFKQRKFQVASKIYQRFQRNYPEHKLASRSFFMAANCLILEQKLNEEFNAKIEEGSKTKKKKVSYLGAIEILSKLIETYKDDKTVRPEAMYWLADCQFKNKEYVGSYQTFKKLTWDYPESKWAKISRGRLTDERFVDIESEGEE